MPNNKDSKKKFEHLRHIQQISEDHCGPAVLEMLLENMGIEVTQEQITVAAGVEKTILGQGTRVDHLALAVNKLAPNAKFWVKQKATLKDLLYVLDNCNFPIGVEWQGLFEDNLEDEDLDENEKGAYGHYSVISNIDTEKNELIIVDPYKDFANQDRIVPISLFLKRWWDFNEFCDPQTGDCTYKKDEQLFFVVTPKSEKFPDELGMTALEL